MQSCIEASAAFESSFTCEDLQEVCGVAEGKISSCEELLDQHSRANESLSTDLKETQSAVSELQSTRVQHDDVEAAVQQKGEEEHEKT